MTIKIFDRYLFKKMIVNFLVICTVLFIVFFLIDNFANGFEKTHKIDEFGLFVKDMTLYLEYYVLYFNRLIGTLFPFLIFLAASNVLYSLDNASSRELIALKTMGASSARIMTPLIIGAIILSLALAAFREIYLPSRVNYLALSRKNFIAHSDEMEVRRAVDDYGQFLLDGEKILFSQKKLIKPRIEVGADYNRYGARFIAASADYLTANDVHPEGWLLNDVTAPTEFLKSPSLKNPENDRIVFYSPADADWLEEDQLFVATHITPTILVAENDWFVYGKINELNAAISDLTKKNRAAKLIISVHTRVERIFTDLIPFFIGIPVYLNMPTGKKSRANQLISGAVAFPYCLCAVFFQILGESVGVPDVAVCGPLIFLPIALTLYRSLFRKQI